MAEGAVRIAGDLMRAASMTATMNGAQAARRSRMLRLTFHHDAIGECRGVSDFALRYTPSSSALDSEDATSTTTASVLRSL